MCWSPPKLFAARVPADTQQAKNEPSASTQAPGAGAWAPSPARVDDGGPSCGLPDSGYNLASSRPVSFSSMTFAYISSRRGLLLRRDAGKLHPERKGCGHFVVEPGSSSAGDFVALPPSVHRPARSLDDDRRDPELAQPCAEAIPALATGDDKILRLPRCRPSFSGLTDSVSRPRGPVTEGA